MQNTANNQTGGIATAKPLTISSPGISFATSWWRWPQSCTAPLPQAPSYSADVNERIKLQNAEPDITRNSAQPLSHPAHADRGTMLPPNYDSWMMKQINDTRAGIESLGKKLRYLSREREWSLVLEHQLKAIGKERAKWTPKEDTAEGMAYSALIRATLVRRFTGEKRLLGLSNHKGISNIIHKVYSLGPYGTLRVAVLDGIVWASLSDAKLITGIDAENLLHVMHRETSINLSSDLLRAGISDKGIPLVGLYFAAKHLCADDSLFYRALEEATIDILNAADAGVDSTSTEVVELWGKVNIN